MLFNVLPLLLAREAHPRPVAVPVWQSVKSSQVIVRKFRSVLFCVRNSLHAGVRRDDAESTGGVAEVCVLLSLQVQNY